MFVSDTWKDFKILDCGDGAKLEQWGGKILIRPEPQAIWQKSKSVKEWNSANAIYVRSSSGGGKWNIKSLPETWGITYNGLKFNIKPMGFKHTGIFPEQATNWDFISNSVRNAKRPINILNLFAYTGASTVAAAAAGASVCHVDASKGMVNFARENAIKNNLKDANIRYIVDDCKKFVLREIKRGNKYDGIIMDPPSYGRGPSGEIWKIEDNIFEFLELTKNLLSKQPLFFILNSYSPSLSPATISYCFNTVFNQRFDSVKCEELGLRVESSNMCIPCGCTLRAI